MAKALEREATPKTLDQIAADIAAHMPGWRPAEYETTDDGARKWRTPLHEAHFTNQSCAALTDGTHFLWLSRCLTDRAKISVEPVYPPATPGYSSSASYDAASQFFRHDKSREIPRGIKLTPARGAQVCARDIMRRLVADYVQTYDEAAALLAEAKSAEDAHAERLRWLASTLGAVVDAASPSAYDHKVLGKAGVAEIEANTHRAYAGGEFREGYYSLTLKGLTAAQVEAVANILKGEKNPA